MLPDRIPGALPPGLREPERQDHGRQRGGSEKDGVLGTPDHPLDRRAEAVPKAIAEPHGEGDEQAGPQDVREQERPGGKPGGAGQRAGETA